MAASGDQSTPEYLTLRKSYRAMVTHFKAQTGGICDALFEKGYIPSSARDYVRTDMIPDERKAEKLVDTLVDKIEQDSSVYSGFINILQSEGPSADSLIVLLEERFKTEQALADCDCSSEDSYHSLSDPDSAGAGYSMLKTKPLIGKTSGKGAKSEGRSSTPESRFRCPFCEKCTVARFFSKAGCPQASQTRNTERKSLFPYLDQSALSEKGKLLVESRLMKDTEEMIKLFADTEDSLIVSLESQKLSVSQLRNYVGTFVIKLGTNEDSKRLEKAANLYDVFFTLKPRFQSFFHYEIIQNVVQKFGSDADQQLMAEYISKFSKFCERSVFEVPPNIFHDSDPEPGDKMFCVKFSKEGLTSLGDVVAVRAKLAEILNIEVFALQLCCITEGCVCLRFLVSANVAEKVFPLSQSQMNDLSEINVKVLDNTSSSSEISRELDEELVHVQSEQADDLAVNRSSEQQVSEQQQRRTTFEGDKESHISSRPSSKRFSSIRDTRLKDGLLYKRQRGRRAHDLRGLKFQQRYCVLSSNGLAYYRDRDSLHKPKGSLQITTIKIVEKVPEITFNRKHCFQVGDEKEVVYFGTSSEREREEWIEALKIAAFELMKGQPLLFYHSGAFGKVVKNLWSCCNKKGREAKGCEPSTHLSVKKQDSSPTDVDTCYEVGLSTSVNAGEFSYDSDSESVGGLDAERQDSDSDMSSGDDKPAIAYHHIRAVARHKTWQSSQSLHSIDSGKGNSINDLSKVHKSSVPRHYSVNKITQHSTSSLRITTKEDSSFNQVSSTLTNSKLTVNPFTQKTIISPVEGYSTLVLYRGGDSVISATNTGKVSLISKLNTTEPQQQTIFTDFDKNPVTVDVWNENFIIGSAKLYYGSLNDPSIIKCYDDIHYKEDVSSMLVALDPNGSLIFAAKNDSTVNVVQNATQNDWSSLKASTTPSEIFRMPGQIFGLAISPYLNEPWLAVGFTFLEDQTTDFVSIINYESRDFDKRPDSEIEIGQNSSPCFAFTYDGQHLYIGSGLRIQCFHTRTSKPAEFNYIFKEKDDSVTSMCCSPVRHRFAVGLNSGKISIFMGDPSLYTPAPTIITDTKINGVVTSLSYSKEDMNLAVAFQDGSVQVWKASKPPEERPLTRTGILLVTSEGQTYHSKEDGHTITIPEGAVKPGTLVHLHYGVAPDSPYGPYEFKDGAQPVSTIISLCPEPADTVFLKPIEVTLPHFIACKTPEDCEKLFFYKAAHDNFETINNVKVYQFEKVVSGANIVYFSQYYEKNKKKKIPQGAASLHIYSNHCRYLCIAKEYSEECTKLLFLQQIIPKHPDFAQGYNIFYCLVYFLDTCIKRVDDQYPEELYDKEKLVVNFLREAEVLQVHISPESLKGGWLLHIHPKQSQIAKEDLRFQNDPLQYNTTYELAHNKMYPPKITLHVKPGESIRESLMTTISFFGVLECSGKTKADFTVDLTKPFQVEGPKFSSPRMPIHSTLATSSLIIKSPREAIDKFQGDFHEIAKNIDCRHLASALFSASSQYKCPYLDSSAVNVTKSFLEKARSSSSDNFSTNFEILTDAYLITERFPEYITAIYAALSNALPLPFKEQLGYHFPCQSPFQGSTTVSSIVETGEATVPDESSSGSRFSYKSSSSLPLQAQQVSSSNMECPGMIISNPEN